MKTPNTVMGIPEPDFRKIWVSKLWQAMAKRAKGYRQYTLKNRPPEGASLWRGERRKDKPGTTKTSRTLGLCAVPTPTSFWVQQ